MTKEIHDINTKALDFVVELIEYIFEYPDDDYMTMECLCRKLHKYGLVDKKDGFYLAADDPLRKTEPSFKVDGIGDDDSTIHAIAHLQKVGWLQEHDRALTEPQTEECNACVVYNGDGDVIAEFGCEECGRTDCAWK